MKIPVKDWKWFGTPGHFICGDDCRFHLCTQVGKVLVSTVGQYFPCSEVREIITKTSGISLKGIGDEREADFLKKIGYVEIGAGRLYETMVFKAGNPCTHEKCNCGCPEINGSEMDFEGYNDASEATKGHYAMCEKWSEGQDMRPALMTEEEAIKAMKGEKFLKKRK